MPASDTEAEELRARIAALERRNAELTDRLATAGEPARLLHELQVHQLELEAQNQALREAQGQLEQSRNRYADLYDFAPAAYVTFDPSGAIQEINLTGAALLGRERVYLLGKPMLALVRFDDAASFVAHLRQCLETRAPAAAELAFSTARGSFAVQATSAPVLDRDGRAVACRTALVDVTARKQAELALARAHETQSRLRAHLEALDRASLAISRSLLTPTGTDVGPLMQRIADEARALAGAEHGALCVIGPDGEPRWSFSTVPADMVEPMRRSVHAAQTLLAESSLLSVRLRDACEHPAFGGLVLGPPTSALAAAIRLGGETKGTLVLVGKRGGEELTEDDEQAALMLAERAAVVLEIARLREIEAREIERLELLAASSVALSDTLEREAMLAGIVRALVPRLADLCWVTWIGAAEERVLVAAHHRDPELVPKVRDLRPSSVVWDALRRGEPFLSRELDGSPALEAPEDVLRALGIRSLLAVPLVLRGRTVGALHLALGSAERRYRPEDVPLAQEIAHHAATALEGARLYRAAQDAIRARDEVLGVVAHDLRNPLNGIRLAASALESDGERDWATVRQVTGLIVRAVRRAERLIDDLVDVVRLEAGELRLEWRRVLVHELLAEALETLGPEAAQAGVTLDAQDGRELPPLEADHGRLLQVLGNLVGNAIKFTPHGGHVRLGAEVHAGALCFSVADTGPGISEAHLPHLFDRFYQAEPGARRSAGLGLAIAKGLVEAHGGRIWVESPPGRGALFRFTIPLPTGLADRDRHAAAS